MIVWCLDYHIFHKNVPDQTIDRLANECEKTNTRLARSAIETSLEACDLPAWPPGRSSLIYCVQK